MARTKTAPDAEDSLLDDKSDDVDLEAEFDEDGEEMPSGNGSTGTTTAPARKYDDQGYQLNKKGQRDSRWKAPIWNPETGELLPKEARPVNGASKSTTVAAPGKTRAEKVLEVFGELTDDGSVRGWEFVSEGTDANGRKSAMGANLKQFYTIRDKDGVELIVGKGEAAKFANVRAPRKERPATNPRKTAKDDSAAEDFGEAFDDAEEGDSEIGDDLLTEDE